MNASSLVVFASLVHFYAPDKKEKLISFLPEEEQKEIAQIKHFPKKIDFAQFAIEKKMEYVHYSWFLPTLKAYAKKDAKLFLLALSKEIAEKVAEHLLLKLPKEKLTQGAKTYLRTLLLSSLSDSKDLLPPEYLPPSSANILTTMTQKKLLHIIEALALVDLAYEIKHIVDPKLLKKIQQALTDWQKHFVKKGLSLSIPSFATKMGLERWDGDIATLRSLLHKRGLRHLAMAIAFEHPDLIWYVSHHLDIGRGNALLRLCEKKMTSNLSQAIMQTIVQIVRFL